MDLLTEQIMTANRAFAAQARRDGRLKDVSKYPNRHLAVVTCMDTRLLDFLEPAMGLSRGEAKIIKVAGSTVFDDFDSVIGSLMVAVYELHVRHIVVMGHDDCGMIATTSESLCRHMAEAGIDDDVIASVRPKLRRWADPIGNADDSVRDTVRRLRRSPYFPPSVAFYGMVIHPGSGEIRLVEDGSGRV